MKHPLALAFLLINLVFILIIVLVGSKKQGSADSGDFLAIPFTVAVALVVDTAWLGIAFFKWMF